MPELKLSPEQYQALQPGDKCRALRVRLSTLANERGLPHYSDFGVLANMTRTEVHRAYSSRKVEIMHQLLEQVEQFIAQKEAS